MNTSMNSIGSTVPIGFRSFVEDKAVDQSINGMPLQEISFAEGQEALMNQTANDDSRLLQEIQNRTSFGVDEDTLENKLPLTSGLQ